MDTTEKQEVATPSSVRLNPAVRSKLLEIGERDDRSLNYLVNKACEEFVAKQGS